MIDVLNDVAEDEAMATIKQNDVVGGRLVEQLIDKAVSRVSR
ncbi:MAG: hypothetical protein JWQ64_3890 [Subtercola sp.]|nr:hypothetical protein [Subtercola sp.]